MKLPLAILKVLTASRRAVSAEVILAFLPRFVEKEPTLTDLERELKSLEAQGYVKGTEEGLHGTLWKETADGRLQVS